MLENRIFYFVPKTPYDVLAERSEANENPLTFPTLCGQGESNSRLLLGRQSFYH